MSSKFVFHKEIFKASKKDYELALNMISSVNEDLSTIEYRIALTSANNGLIESMTKLKFKDKDIKDLNKRLKDSVKASNKQLDMLSDEDVKLDRAEYSLRVLYNSLNDINQAVCMAASEGLADEVLMEDFATAFSFDETVFSLSRKLREYVQAKNNYSKGV